MHVLSDFMIMYTIFLANNYSDVRWKLKTRVLNENTYFYKLD